MGGELDIVNDAWSALSWSTGNGETGNLQWNGPLSLNLNSVKADTVNNREKIWGATMGLL